MARFQDYGLQTCARELSERNPRRETDLRARDGVPTGNASFLRSIDNRLLNLKTRQIPLDDHGAMDSKWAAPQCHGKFHRDARGSVLLHRVIPGLDRSLAMKIERRLFVYARSASIRKDFLPASSVPVHPCRFGIAAPNGKAGASRREPHGDFQRTSIAIGL